MVEDLGVKRLPMIGTVLLAACSTKAPPPSATKAAPPTLYAVESLVRPSTCRGFQQLWTVPADLAPQCLTRDALARALTTRYGGLVQAHDIVDLMRMTEPDEADETLHVQACREGRTDWYAFTTNGAGQIDHTSIHQLPF